MSGTMGSGGAKRVDAGGNPYGGGGDEGHGIHCDFVRSLQDLPAWGAGRENSAAATHLHTGITDPSLSVPPPPFSSLGVA